MTDKCGCYDGPYMEGSKMLVSVRCWEHRAVAAKPHHSLMLRKDDGGVQAIAPRDKLNGAQALALKEAKQKKRYA